MASHTAQSGFELDVKLQKRKSSSCMNIQFTVPQMSSPYVKSFILNAKAKFLIATIACQNPHKEYVTDLKFVAFPTMTMIVTDGSAEHKV